MANKINVDKIYLINLERRYDRLEHFLNECKKESIDTSNLCIFKAYDAKTYNIKDNELEMFRNINFGLNTSFSKTCICNQLSHYNILKDIVKNKYKKCIIFQDDVRFRKNFRKDINNILENMPKDTEALWIGLHKKAAGSYFEDFPIEDINVNKFYVKEKINEYVCKYNNDINPCSLAYIITYKGAKNYIDYVTKKGFTNATDDNYNRYFISKDIFYGSLDVLCTGNSKFKSDVFESDVNAIERDMMELLGI
jgi:GR25 family glycosyltransferase involved in LPS biosynthesis